MPMKSRKRPNKSRPSKHRREQQHISDILSVLGDLSRYNDIVFLKRLIHLARLTNKTKINRNFVVSQRGLSYLVHLIHFVCANKTILSEKDVMIIVKILNIIRKLLGEAEVMKSFVRQNGMTLLNHLLTRFEDEQVMMNAVVEVLGYAAATPMGRKSIKYSGVVEAAVNVLQNHPQNGVLMTLCNSKNNLTPLLGLPLITEPEPEPEPEAKKNGDREPVLILNQLKKNNRKLANKKSAQNFFSRGNVMRLLEYIQEFSFDPNIISEVLDALNHLAQIYVDGVFKIIEEVGVLDGIIQCMMKHKNHIQIQYKCLTALTALAKHDNQPLVTTALCQPIYLDTALQALQENIATNPAMVKMFARFVFNLLQHVQNHTNSYKRIKHVLCEAGITEALNTALLIYPTQESVQMACNTALDRIDPFRNIINPFGELLIKDINSDVDVDADADVNACEDAYPYHNYTAEDFLIVGNVFSPTSSRRSSISSSSFTN